MASLASFHANVGALLSLRKLWYFSNTLSAESSLALSIWDDGKRFFPFALISKGDDVVDTVDAVDTVTVVETVDNSVDCIGGWDTGIWKVGTAGIEGGAPKAGLKLKFWLYCK